MAPVHRSDKELAEASKWLAACQKPEQVEHAEQARCQYGTDAYHRSSVRTGAVITKAKEQKMGLRSHLYLRVHPGQREIFVAKFMERQVFEECAEAIEGYNGSEILLSQDDTDCICIVTYWDNKAASEQWLSSPVRAAQESDLGQFVAETPTSELFEVRA